jgi:hypothetical protein
MCMKGPVLLYREVISSHLHGVIKENDENMSRRTFAIGEIWTCDLFTKQELFKSLSEKILDWAVSFMVQPAYTGVIDLVVP